MLAGGHAHQDVPLAPTAVHARRQRRALLLGEQPQRAFVLGGRDAERAAAAPGVAAVPPPPMLALLFLSIVAPSIFASSFVGVANCRQTVVVAVPPSRCACVVSTI